MKLFLVNLDCSKVHVCNTSSIMLSSYYDKLLSFPCHKTVYYVVLLLFFSRKTSEVTKLTDDSTFTAKARNALGLSNIELTRADVICMTSNDCYVTSQHLQTNGAEYEDMDQYCTIPE